jgi:hypothetical protein
MVYGIVETLVFAGLLELLHFFPEERWWLGPATAINVVAIVLSLTRTLWVCSLLILACHLAWTRSRWIWALPAIPSLLFLVAPGAVRTRIIDSARPDYYANSERVQMLQFAKTRLQELVPGALKKSTVNTFLPGTRCLPTTAICITT